MNAPLEKITSTSNEHNETPSNCLIQEILKDPYRSRIPGIIRKIKILIQFSIGASLLIVLTLKGALELLQTFENLSSETPFISHLLGIKTFSYIASALAISSGVELGYMLFTDGPDEAISPLMLCISSAAFYTVADNPGGNWVIGIYAISILILMFCLKKYKDWKLDPTEES